MKRHNLYINIWKSFHSSQKWNNLERFGKVESGKMIFTLYYMYATFIQWWRLGSLRNKLNGTVNSHNALLVCSETVVYDTKKSRSFENLLFRNEERIGCTVVPRQKVNLSQWVVFPKDYRYFPIFFKSASPKLSPPHVHILIQAMLDTYVKHSADLLEIENFGELVGWRVADYFEAVLKTDMDKLAKLVHCYSQGNIDINHELKLLKIETVDVEGIPTRIKYDRKFSTDFILKYSHSPVHWRQFTESVKELYAKIRDSTNPKITIENGKSDEIRKVPVSEVKPIKKDRKHEDRHTLDVASEERRRHKTTDHKKEKTSPSRSEAQTRDETPRRRDEDRRRASRAEESSRHHRKEDRSKHRKEEDERDGDVRAKEEDRSSRRKDGDRETHHRKEESRSRSRHHDKDRERDRSRKSEGDDVKKDTAETPNQTQKDSKRQPSKDRVRASTGREEAECSKPKRESSKGRLEKSKSKERESSSVGESSKSNKKETVSKESSHKQDTKPEKKLLKEKSKSESHQKLERTPAKRSGSGDKKLVKRSLAVDNTEHELKTSETLKENVESTSASGGGDAKSNGHLKTNGNFMMARSSSIKPPNILVYADSLVAKDNVKIALTSMLNREKYTIYDLPVDSKQMMWDQSTVLVVVCGTVPPNLTFNLLQYLLQGGQLLCLCSDLLYSVLHTFTTAEVREHELVCFNYGRWKQVKMMHHIFCYQASPAKKQFSKDSDHSNQSTGSSPIAPRTPSSVELQHNGKDYTMQVQVLGTEETWQTPSLLLATVKGGEGRAIFSQVHLEINPNQFEDDENKFEALKNSDQARLEILKDILASHLDIDCSSSEEPEYTPGYFLGRHEMKMKLLTEGNAIKNSVLEMENLTVKFCGKNETPEPASKNFLPVFIHSCPSNFSTVNYFEALETQHIGRLVIYSDVMSSSQAIIAKTLTHGLVVIPRRQVRSVGRSNNTWISPEGSASFSLQMHIDIESPLGKCLPLLQHLIMVAVVSAIKTVRGCEDLNIGIKWPNDLYVNGHIKIGGVMLQSSITDRCAIMNIGCGVNLNNPNPTMCINELISVTNETKGSHMSFIPYEAYFAAVFNEIERIYNKVQNGEIDYMYDLYYKYWLHNNCDITVSTASGDSEYVKIIGIDDYGYLKVRSPNGSIASVQPDGNTFDMLRGLIYPKPF
ncbi:unnamed protein product [Callosobruchus maculatus]|uniref:BPL/LPL catalytic domain-containing protein n=3 Tax=Callosobruchus maculatus TaxID=64391 RepID=A0A653DS72_CALMS|nr:unnamed protein product [Callosobruchus maculatus]